MITKPELSDALLMTRVFHAEALALNQEIELDDFAAQHLGRVLRVKLGDEIKVFNPSGEFCGHISALSKSMVRVLLKKKLDVSSESSLHTSLIQAVTRRERMDYSIQKATELGVTLIQPVMTEHCVVKLDAKKVAKKRTHWQGIARHASEQSGRLSIPEIRPVITFAEAIENTNDDLQLIFALQASQDLKSITQEQVKSVSLVIGPVGGFSEREVQKSLDEGFRSIRFGPRVLRSETATAAMLTAVQMRWGDLR